MLLGFKYSIPNLRIEGYYSLLCELTTTDTENTLYAKGYSDRKFLKIKKGMTEKQATDILGFPLSTWNYNQSESEYCLMYSESPTSQDYRMRKFFINNGKVKRIFGFYYND